ncbi:hypothetical protein ACP275_10G032400 [Erythranthe tilingii]
MDNNPSSGQTTKNNITTSSYSCSFCRRGFSNAQALGGHMNIHRRDRAKLMMIDDGDDDFSRQNPPSLLDHHHMIITTTKIGTDDDDDDDDNNNKNEIIINVEDNLIHRSLPLITNQEVAAPPAESNGGREEKAKTEKLRLIGEDEDQLLDLELRLGPLQPNHYSRSKPL